MSTSDPIRLSDIRKEPASISRVEAERQFKFSFALVIILTVATLSAVATVPVSGSEGGYGVQHVASQPVTVR